MTNALYFLFPAVVCTENRERQRTRQCFATQASRSGIGYWLRLGSSISRIVGFSPHRQQFLLRDRDDKSFLLTADAQVLHPIRQQEASVILSHADFRPAVPLHWFRSVNASLHQEQERRRGFAADQDFVYSLRPHDQDYDDDQPLDRNVLAVWSSASCSFLLQSACT